MPAFILGCQRSGTTICQNVFAGSRKVAVFREGSKEAMTDGWRLRPYDEIQSLIDRQKARLILFKPINDSQSALEILDRFDNSRVVWIFRHFNDTANSAVVHWGASQRDMVVWIGENLAKHGSLEEAMPAILQKPSFAVYAEKMSAESAALLVEWTRAPISEHTGAAIMWYLRNQLFFEQSLDTNPRSLIVRYEKFVQQPDEQLRQICKFLSIRHSKKRSSSVVASSIGRYDAPEIPPAVLEACSGLLDRLNQAEQVRPAPPSQQS